MPAKQDFPTIPNCNDHAPYRKANDQLQILRLKEMELNNKINSLDEMRATEKDARKSQLDRLIEGEDISSVLMGRRRDDFDGICAQAWRDRELIRKAIVELEHIVDLRMREAADIARKAIAPYLLQLSQEAVSGVRRLAQNCEDIQMLREAFHDSGYSPGVAGPFGINYVEISQIGRLKDPHSNAVRILQDAKEQLGIE